MSAPRWYVVNRLGCFFELCDGGEDEARKEAEENDKISPIWAPHRAVQMVEVTGAVQAQKPKPDHMTTEAWRQLTEVIPFRMRQVENGCHMSLFVMVESIDKMACELGIQDDVRRAIPSNIAYEVTGGGIGRDDVLRLARESGFQVDEADFITAPKSGRIGFQLELERFATLVAASERAARQAAQAENADLHERLARTGVEQRRAVHDAVLAEREACATVLDSNADRCDPHSIAFAILESNAAAIRARITQ